MYTLYNQHIRLTDSHQGVTYNNKLIRNINPVSYTHLEEHHGDRRERKLYNNKEENDQQNILSLIHIY